MTEDESALQRLQVVREALYNLKRKGLVVSKLCDDGQILWFSTEKPLRGCLG
jgi:hypothetical protein